MEPSETTEAPGNARVVDHERDLRDYGHFFWRCAEQVDERRLARDQTARGSSQRVGDAFNASHGNVRAVRVNGDDGFRVWIQLAHFGRIDRAVRALWNFHQSHVCAGVDHAGIDWQTAAVDRLSSSRDGDIRADCFDLSITNYDGAVFDVWSADGDDTSVANREDASRRNNSLLSGRVADLLSQYRSRKKK